MRRTGPVERVTRSRVTAVFASCASCDWSSDAANAQANGARHHDATGHEVTVAQHLLTIYGEQPSPEELGQLTIGDTPA